MKLKNLLICNVAVLASSLVASSAQASDIALDFTSLPSAQGWTYITDPTNPRLETEIFALSSGVLTQDSIGDGDGRFLYQYTNDLDWTKPFAISVRSRLLSDVGGASRRLGAFGFYAFSGSKAYGVIFRPGIIQNYAETVIATTVDTASFHDYVLEIDPTTGYRLFVDGVQVNSGAGVNLVSGTRNIAFGDGTRVVEARAEVAQLRILQAVPEPSTYALVFAGGIFLIYVTRRREGANAKRHSAK